MAINSIRKGKRGELEAAKFLREECGFSKVRRGQQFKGGPESPDILQEEEDGIPGELDGLHFEIKRTEKLHILKAMQQAILERRDDQIPVVMWRKNHEDWYVILRAKDYFKP